MPSWSEVGHLREHSGHSPAIVNPRLGFTSVTNPSLVPWRVTIAATGM